VKQIFKKEQKFGCWILMLPLGVGGNGEVWQCQDSNKNIRAIKLLKKVNAKSYLRFIDEVNAVDKSSDIEGIVPIIDKYFPEDINKEVPFFVMPLAEKSDTKLLGKAIEEKIDAIIEVARTLKQLHKREIYHRDIKPANILYYNSKYCIADFGLVDFPDKNDISQKNEEIGAKWTIAPEMRRESSAANGAKADIYSLAKTLWIYLTNKTKGFDGQYSVDSIIDLKKSYPGSYTSPIDNLLIACTDNDPDKRLSIEEFISELEKWKKLSEHFHDRIQQQWFEIQTKLFPAVLPTRVIFEDINDIIKVLNVVCSFDNLNHLFFPNGGGLDLHEVRISNEQGCIELDFKTSILSIAKPKRLLFESFNYDPEWNYFRLELDNLDATKLNSDEEGKIEYEEKEGRERVSELSPGNYYPNDILEYYYNYESDYLITSFSRQVTRWFRGCFVIFCKRSSYNLITETYDGRHNKMSADKFREYIQTTIDAIKVEKNKYSPSILEKDGVPKKEIKHFVEESIVYRCGWCGKIIDEDGLTLDEYTHSYNIKVMSKYGQSVVKKKVCISCKEREV
jgi:serine/threonine protein kinase